MALTNAERQRRYRAKHPEALRMARWYRRLRTLLRDCPNTDVREAIRYAVTPGSPRNDTPDGRVTRQADGTPALRCSVIFGQRQADEWLAWHDAREAALKAGKWADWNPGDMAARTMGVQMLDYYRRAFSAAPRRAHVTA